MQLIGLSGYARSGKDTFADVLVERHGYTKVAFADTLRKFLYAQNPLVGHYFDGDWVKYPEPVRLREVIDKYGWNGYKNTPYVDEIRPLVQRTGTEAGRNTLWEDIWVDATFKNLDPKGKYVISDARFPNEADGVVSRGGIMVRIERPGVGPAVDTNGVAHPSETSLDDYRFDYKLENDGTVGDFEEEIDWLMFSAVGHGKIKY